MRVIPWLHWNRRHNLASIWVSFAGTLWDHRELEDAGVLLGYSATGRLARVLLLDPRRLLPPAATVHDALVVALGLLEGRPDVARRDVEVVRSALGRARPDRARSAAAGA